MTDEISWSQDMMLEVTLKEPANITKNDVERRNRIAKLLFDWGLVDFQAEDLTEVAPLNQIKVLSYKDKADWILESKYNIGKKKVVAET